MKMAAARTAMMTARGLEMVVLPALGGAPSLVGTGDPVEDVDDLVEVSIVVVELPEVDTVLVVGALVLAADVDVAAEVVEVAEDDSEEEETKLDMNVNRSE
ncbi:hypothetical protein AA313_de0209454 [Arthrobotrys entomopaga]|nr:hypothetical protein AA313_de0209454 [Arthrobotrys entomopaga]